MTGGKRMTKPKPVFTQLDADMCRRFDVMMRFQSIQLNSAWITIDAMYYFEGLANRIEAFLGEEEENETK